MIEVKNSRFDRKVRFLSKLTTLTIILLFPILLMAFFLEQYTSIGISILVIIVLLFGNVLLTRNKLEIYLLILCGTIYPLLAVYPFLDQPVHGLYLSFVSVFLIVNYFNTKQWLHTVNIAGMSIGIIIFTIVVHYWGKGFNMNFLYNFLCIVHSVFIVAAASYFTLKEIHAYQQETSQALQFLHQMSDLNPHFIFAKDKERRFTFVNQAFLDILGKNREEVYGKKWEELFANLYSLDLVKKADQEVLEGQKKSIIPEELIIDKNGNERYWETIKTPMYDEHGKLIGILGVSTDFTEKRKAEKALIKSEKYYRAIFDNNQVGIVTSKKNAPSFNSVNQAFCDMVGYAKEELQHMKITDVIYEEDYHKHAETVVRFENNEIDSCNVEHRYWRKDGSLGYAMTTFSGARDDNGIIIDLIVNIIDISKLKEVEEALREKELFYRTLFETIPLGVLIVDTEVLKRPIDCNEYWPKLLGCDKQTIMKGNMLTVSPSYQPNQKTSEAYLSELMSKYRSDWNPFQVEWCFQRANGTIFLGEVLFTPLQLDDHQLSIMVIRDITEKKAQEKIIADNLDLLHLKNEELKKYIDSNMQLENFAYLASHDLKSPIRTIVSFSQLLEKSAKSKLNMDELEYLDFIVDGSLNMKDLIEDLLSYSRVNTQNFLPKEINLNYLIDAVKQQLKVTIEEKKAKIITRNLPTKLYADHTQMRQIFQNLISNAIKFTRPDINPMIEIYAEELTTHWKFSVSDNGIGIDEAYQEQIFLLFRQLHGKGEYEGTGIGLSMCKSIAENHKGEIGVRSELGKGTTFYFTISKHLERAKSSAQVIKQSSIK